MHLLSSFRVLDETHDAKSVLGWHVHDAPMLSLVFEGQYAEHYPSRGYECGALDLVVKPAGERHRDIVGSKGARSLLVEILETAPAMGAFLSSIDEPQHVKDPTVRTLIDRAHREWHDRDSLMDLALEAVFLELMLVVSRHNSVRMRKCRPGWLQRAEDYLDVMFRNEVALRDVARECGVHPAHLARTFRKWNGRTIGEHVRALRIASATSALTKTNRPLSEIAVDSGFCDQAHMGRTLRKYLGVTPLELRRRS